MSDTSGHAEREQTILNAASGLFIHYGYDKTTVEDIAREANVAKGTIYLHFKSKDELFDVLLTLESDRSVQRMFDLIEGDADGVTVYTLFRYGWQAVQENPLIRALYLRDRRVIGDFAKRMTNAPQYNQMLSLTGDFIRQFQALGLIRSDLDADALMYVLMSFRYGLFMGENLMPSGIQPSIELVGDVITKLLTEGIAPPKGSTSEEARRVAQDIFDQGLAYVRQQLQKK